jgi:hypothetical protein
MIEVFSVPSIKFIFDSEMKNGEDIESNIEVFNNNYEFNEGNDYTFTLQHQFSSYGLFKTVAILTNDVTTKRCSTLVAVGTGLTTKSINGYINNNFVNENEGEVEFYLRAAHPDDTGYTVTFTFGDGNQMFVPWNKIQTFGKATAPTQKSFVPLNVEFNEKLWGRGVMIAKYKYTKASVYEVTAYVSNPFGHYTHKYCSKVTVNSIGSLKKR